jgi:type I restriction enzyme S subunit
MSNIKYQIKDIAIVKNGSTPSTGRDDYYDGDISWITPKDLSDSKKKYISRGQRSITLEGFNSCSTTLLPAGSILLSSRAPIGLLAIASDTVCTNQGFKNLVLKENKINNEYLYYWLKTQVDYISSLGTGTTFKEVSKSVIEDLVVDLPENVKTQSQIAKVLSDLDAKIELNNKINAELEAMAKLIYDYWFVQFEFPNEEGKPYKSSGGKMVWNEELKREVPEGWEIGTLLDIATFTNGHACQKFRPVSGETSYKVIKIREMSDGFGNDPELVSQSVPERIIINNGDVLFSWSATLEVKIWTGGIGALNQHIFKITSKKYPRTYYYFELLSYLQHFKMIAELRKTTMGHITQDHLKQSRITIPPSKLIDKIHDKINPLIQQMILNREQNQKLAELRDWLLPMLMNGQVNVDKLSEHEEQLNMAAEEREKYR